MFYLTAFQNCTRPNTVLTNPASMSKGVYSVNTEHNRTETLLTNQMLTLSN